jgi:hypothetical protein
LVTTNIKQVEHVVLRTGFKRAHEGKQRGHAAFLGHPGHGLRLGDGRETSQRRHAGWRNVSDSRQARRQKPDFIKTINGACQLGAAAQIRSVSQTIERAWASPVPCQQQGVELFALRARDVTGHRAPQSARGPVTNPRHQPLKGGRTWQQHLLGYQPGRCAVE